jgi:hypothetical protein
LADRLDKLNGKEKVSLIKESLLTIGEHIGSVISKVPTQSKEQKEAKLWSFTSLYWPGDADGASLSQMYAKVSVALSRNSSKGDGLNQ